MSNQKQLLYHKVTHSRAYRTRAVQKCHRRIHIYLYLFTESLVLMLLVFYVHNQNEFLSRFSQTQYNIISYYPKKVTVTLRANNKEFLAQNMNSNDNENNHHDAETTNSACGTLLTVTVGEELEYLQRPPCLRHQQLQQCQREPHPPIQSRSPSSASTLSYDTDTTIKSDGFHENKHFSGKSCAQSAKNAEQRVKENGDCDTDGKKSGLCRGNTSRNTKKCPKHQLLCRRPDKDHFVFMLPTHDVQRFSDYRCDPVKQQHYTVDQQALQQRRRKRKTEPAHYYDHRHDHHQQHLQEYRILHAQYIGAASAFRQSFEHWAVGIRLRAETLVKALYGITSTPPFPFRRVSGRPFKPTCSRPKPKSKSLCLIASHLASHNTVAVRYIGIKCELAL